MRTTPLRVTIGAVSLIAALFAGTAAAPAAGQQSYIVVLDAGTEKVGAVAADLAKAHGGQVGYVYQHALKGFSITVGPRGAAGLARNPQVAYVEADQERSIDAQTIPTGIERIFADDNGNIDIDNTDDFRVDVDVAVIDTGIDFEHPDLDVVGGVDCSGGSPFNSSCSSGGDDDHFHGTHVAGTVAAIDNGEGVVGVAPGARLWAVKVLNSRGSGYASWIVAGIDWVAAHGGIEVANMSLGGSGFSQAEYDAIQGAVEAGVAFAVAAGNSDDDANNYSPAAFDNVLTVSALADFNGQPGGGAAPTCRDDQDDTLADFSNWGSAVQIAAPGVCILSTFPIEDGSYGTISGTSMASPHAAGALALLASGDNSPENADAVFALYDQVINSGNFDWTDDSGDGIKEPLLDVSNTTLFAPALIAGGGDINSPPTASFTFACTDLSCDFDGSESSDSEGSIASHAWDFGDGNTAIGATVSHTYGAAGTYMVTLTVTDDDGATGTATEEVTVGETGEASMHVSDVSVSLEVQDTKARATAVVTVVDETGNPVPDATVTGDWLLNSTLVTSDQTALTGSDGQASLIKRFDGIASGDVIEFCVTDITHDTLVYDPTSNIETCGEATVGGNQAPTASFTFSCTDLSCDFDASGSSDPDGTISSYDWGFGDGNSGSGTQMSHTYGAAGTYMVTLTVTDDDGATGTATKPITVGETGEASMHVADISVSLEVRDTKAKATAVVTVVDETGDPVPDATVTGDWLFNGTLVRSGQTAITGSNGQASLIHRFEVVASGDVIEFCVTDITHDSLVYDPTSNLETCGQATVP